MRENHKFLYFNKRRYFDRTGLGLTREDLLSLTVRLGSVVTVLDDHIGGGLRLALKPIVENSFRSIRVSSLSVKGGSTVVSYHTVSTTTLVGLHRSPTVVLKQEIAKSDNEKRPNRR